MIVRRRGYFPRISKILAENKIPVKEVVAGTALSEKTVRTMIRGDYLCARESVERVLVFLAARGIYLKIDHEFLQDEADG